MARRVRWADDVVDVRAHKRNEPVAETGGPGWEVSRPTSPSKTEQASHLPDPSSGFNALVHASLAADAPQHREEQLLRTIAALVEAVREGRSQIEQLNAALALAQADAAQHESSLASAAAEADRLRAELRDAAARQQADAAQAESQREEVAALKDEAVRLRALNKSLSQALSIAAKAWPVTLPSPGASVDANADTPHVNNDAPAPPVSALATSRVEDPTDHGLGQLQHDYALHSGVAEPATLRAAQQLGSARDLGAGQDAEAFPSPVSGTSPPRSTTPHRVVGRGTLQYSPGRPGPRPARSPSPMRPSTAAVSSPSARLPTPVASPREPAPEQPSPASSSTPREPSSPHFSFNSGGGFNLSSLMALMPPPPPAFGDNTHHNHHAPASAGPQRPLPALSTDQVLARMSRAALLATVALYDAPRSSSSSSAASAH